VSILDTILAKVNAVLWIRTRKDSRHFDNLDPHPHQIKMRIRIRIKIYKLDPEPDPHQFLQKSSQNV
jgi:hypothetical protein